MDRRKKVVITDFIVDSLEPERRILGDLADVVSLNAFNEDDLIGRIEDADAVMLYHNMGLTRKTIERLANCKLIVRCGVGYDNVDHALARRRGIAVANVPDYGSEEVADSAVGLMLALARGIHQLNSLLRDGIEPWRYSQAAPLYRLRGRTFGIVGLGRIGTAAALRAKALGMNVLFYDPYKPCGYDKSLGVSRIENLGELLGQSNVLSLHCADRGNASYSQSQNDFGVARRRLSDQYRARRGGRYDRLARGVGFRPIGRRGHRRARPRTAACRRSAVDRLARSESSRPPPLDRQSARGVL